MAVKYADHLGQLLRVRVCMCTSSMWGQKAAILLATAGVCACLTLGGSCGIRNFMLGLHVLHHPATALFYAAAAVVGAHAVPACFNRQRLLCCMSLCHKTLMTIP